MFGRLPPPEDEDEMLRRAIAMSLEGENEEEQEEEEELYSIRHPRASVLQQKKNQLTITCC